MNSNRLSVSMHVMVGVVIDSADRVLIAQRPAGTHLEGGWEFPGGKLEPGEDRLRGLARELREELGISISTPRPLIRVKHLYPNREVLLDTWVIRRFSGDPVGLDGQALRWCSLMQLMEAELLPADKPIVAALRLPEILTEHTTSDFALTDFSASFEKQTPEEDLDHEKLRGVICRGAQEVRAAALGGADFLALNDEMAPCEVASLCEEVPVPIFARLADLHLAWQLGASGINELGF